VDFVEPEIEAYAAAHATQPEPLLAELAEETRASLRSPQMLTGTIEGRFLELLVHGLAAKRVLELGTYSGYGTLSMAAGLPEGGSTAARSRRSTPRSRAATSSVRATPIV